MFMPGFEWIWGKQGGKEEKHLDPDTQVLILVDELVVYAKRRMEDKDRWDQHLSADDDSSGLPVMRAVAHMEGSTAENRM